MPRGGRRKGTPGKGYSNRTDLQMDYNNEEMSAAAGGAPNPQVATQRAPMFPEDTPMLTDPTQRPSEPISAGLPIGAGPGPTGMDPRLEETRKLKQWLPVIEPLLDQDDTPMSVRALVRYIKGS